MSQFVPNAYQRKTVVQVIRKRGETEIFAEYRGSENHLSPMEIQRRFGWCDVAYRRDE